MNDRSTRWLIPGSWDSTIGNDSGFVLPFGDTLPGAVSPVSQIVFIDGSVPDAQELAHGVKPGVVAVILNPDADGVQQIANWLATHDVQGVTAIDIVAHGADGMIQLGSVLLSSATIGTYASQLAQIGAALGPDGAIQLYGCDVAQDANGVAFLQQLSQATGGANIAAASHEIGSAAQGGNWDLNIDVGTVDVAAPFTANAEADFSGVLPVAVNQLFAAFNNGAGDSLTRIVQTGVSNTSTVGSQIDLQNGTQTTNFANLQGLAVDAAAGKYFVVNSDNSTVNDILEGNISGGGSLTTLYSAPDLADFELSGLAIDEPAHVIYFAQISDDSSQDGIYQTSETGGSATAVVTGLTAPINLALDTTHNLIFITENQGIGSGVNQLDVYNVSTGTLTVLNSQLGTSVLGDIDTNAGQLTGAAVNPATEMLYFTALNGGTVADNFIFDAHYTITNGSITLGTVNTLYAGSHAGTPAEIAIDAADGIFYVGNDSSQAIDEGSLTNTNTSVSVSQVLQLSSSASTEPNGLFFLSTPTVAASGTVSYAQNGTAVALDPGLTVGDPDGQDLASATVAITSGFLTGDTLTATLTGGITSSFSNGTLTLSATGGATLANFQSVLESVKYSTTAANPTLGGSDDTRSISWTINDGVITSTTPTTTLDIHAAVISAGATATFTGGGSAVALDGSLTAKDSLGSDFTSATVTIANFVSGDTLHFTTQNGITQTSFNNGTLILGGSASFANYQAALRSITYSFTAGGDPTNGGNATSRSISWAVNDGTVVSPTATSTLELVHAAPTIQASGTVTYAQNGSPVTLDNSIGITAPDSSNELTKATVAITGGFLASDTLTVGSNPGALAVGFSSGTLMLTGTSSVANYLAALDSVQFSNSSDPTNGNTDTSRTISWAVNDGVSNSAISASNVQTTLCFCAGTRIATPAGEVAVERLTGHNLPGNGCVSQVETVFSGFRPIMWIGRRQVDCSRHADPHMVWPVRIGAGAFGNGQPKRALYLSPDHAVFVDNVLIPVKYLIDGATITQEPRNEVTYYHVELEEHDVLVAEGLPVESYLDTGDRCRFDNGGGPVTLHPDFSIRAWEAKGCAPLIVTGPVLDTVRARLQHRAALLAVESRRQPGRRCAA